MGRRTRVIVVGAGFGGLEVARRLAGSGADVLLLDRHNYHTFYPLLYQIGAAEIDVAEIAYPVRKIVRGWRGVRFRMAEARGVDFDGRRLRISTPDGAGEAWLPWDHLVVAAGSDAHYFGVPGAEAHAFPLRQVEHGLALRNHVLSRFERAEAERDHELRRRALAFVIVGGGATGVEFAGALAELIHGPLLRDHPRLDPREVRILLLEAAGGLLGGMPDELGAYAARRLGRMGVEVRTGTAVERVRADGVELAGGTALAAETVVWTAGVRGASVGAAWGLPTDRQGRVDVEPTLAVRGRPDVWVVGDLAAPASGQGSLPMVAPVAIQQGEAAARNILLASEGLAPRPFRYRDPGLLATIGRNAAVAGIFGRTFTGFPAWLLWVGVHIARLIGFRNRIVVLTNWAWDYLRYERVVRLILPLAEAARLVARANGSGARGPAPPGPPSGARPPSGTPPDAGG